MFGEDVPRSPQRKEDNNFTPSGTCPSRPSYAIPTRVRRAPTSRRWQIHGVSKRRTSRCGKKSRNCCLEGRGQGKPGKPHESSLLTSLPPPKKRGEAEHSKLNRTDLMNPHFVQPEDSGVWGITLMCCDVLPMLMWPAIGWKFQERPFASKLVVLSAGFCGRLQDSESFGVLES